MTDQQQVRVVNLHVSLPPGPLPDDSVLRVRVEDHSMADRAAPVVATAELPVDPGTKVVEGCVEIPLGLLDPRASYSAFVHLDVGCTGEVKSGDALTTRVHPLPEPGASDDLDVELTRI